MIPQTPGKIFLADQRGLRETDRFRRYSTFNFGDFQHEHKAPFGRLLALNEETLAPGHHLVLPVLQATYLLVLPLTGAVEVRPELGPATTVEVQEVRLLALPAGNVVQLVNPYEEEMIHCLHLWLAADAPLATATQLFPFDLSTAENQLIEVLPAATVPALPFSLSLGRFAGRQEAVYQLNADTEQLFAFVIAGAFEVEGRLLHEKDGLALWQTAEIELEALSNDALILVMKLAK